MESQRRDATPQPHPYDRLPANTLVRVGASRTGFHEPVSENHRAVHPRH